MHRFLPGLTYMVTGSTLYKQHFFRDRIRLAGLQEVFLDVMSESGWLLLAWVLLSNHYHFLAQCPETGGWTLKALIQGFHSIAGAWLNGLENTAGRQVLYQYWDTCITHDASYFARLNYVNENPVHHGLVAVASAYPFSSARQFELGCSSAFRRRLSSYGWKRAKVVDDFDPICIDL